MTFRDAQTTTDVSTGGFQLFQTAYIDSNGNITSFTTGDIDNQVTKHFSASLLQIKYKRSASPLFFLIGDVASFSWDGTTLTQHNHASMGTSFRHGIVFKNQYYVIKGDGTLWKSADLETWSNTGVTYAMSLATDGNILAVCLVGTSIKYSTDGVYFATQNTWDSAPAQVNSIKHLNGNWIAVGLYPESGDFTMRPWVAASTNISAGWSSTLSPYGGTGDTAILDVAMSGSDYLFYVAMSYYNANLYIWKTTGFTIDGDYDFISSNIGYYNIDRSNNIVCATNDGKIVAPIQPYQYMLGIIDADINDYVYFPGTDKNGASYFVAMSGSQVMIKDSNYNTVTTAPSAVYGVGGVNL